MDEHKLRETFAQCLELPLALIHDDLAYDSVPQWDSVAHMALVAGIEDAFGILIDTDDVIDMGSFAKARAIVARYLAAASA